MNAGDRVRTPSDGAGTVRLVRRQELPHGGVMLRGGGISSKRARPGEVEQAIEQLKTYAVVDLDKGGRATYDVAVLEWVELNDGERVEIAGRFGG